VDLVAAWDAMFEKGYIERDGFVPLADRGKVVRTLLALAEKASAILKKEADRRKEAARKRRKEAGVAGKKEV